MKKVAQIIELVLEYNSYPSWDRENECDELNLSLEAIEAYHQQIKDKYSEYKRKNSFTDSAKMAKREVIELILKENYE